MHNKYTLKALILIITVLNFQNDTRNVTSKLQALNCLITWSIGALQMGQGSPLNFKTCAHCKQQQQCPVSPWMIVAFLGCSIQIMHFELSSVSSGKANAFPFSVISAIEAAFDSDSAVVTRSRVSHGFSSGWRLKRASKKKKINCGRKKHRKWFETWSHVIQCWMVECDHSGNCSLNMTVADNDRCFDRLCGSHLYSQI